MDLVEIQASGLCSGALNRIGSVILYFASTPPPLLLARVRSFQMEGPTGMKCGSTTEGLAHTVPVYDGWTRGYSL